MDKNIKLKEEIDIWYKTHNMVYEKTELYCDFFVSVTNLIDNTYLGHDVTITEEDMLGHFRWCFNKVIDNFKKENITFNSKGEHFEYLWKFFHESFYLSDNPNKIKKIEEYFKHILSLDYKKTQFELDMMSEFYKILDKNLKF